MAEMNIADVPESNRFQFQSADSSDIMPRTERSESRERIRD